MTSKKILVVTFVATLGLMSASAHAHRDRSYVHNLFHSVGGSHSGGTAADSSGNGGGGGGQSVPELDAAVGPLALALLGGVVAVGLERRRRKNKRNDTGETEDQDSENKLL